MLRLAVDGEVCSMERKLVGKSSPLGRSKSNKNGQSSKALASFRCVVLSGNNWTLSRFTAERGA